MRIGIFHRTLPEAGRKIGGVEIFVHRLANAMSDRGHELTVYSFADEPPADARYALWRVGRKGLSESRVGRFGICPAVLNRLVKGHQESPLVAS